MALVSEDIIVSQQTGWMAVVLTGTKIYINEIRRSEILVKFDINSNSVGFNMNTHDTLVAEETIYIKTNRRHDERDAIIVIARD